jgi:hypothetical protein
MMTLMSDGNVIGLTEALIHASRMFAVEFRNLSHQNLKLFNTTFMLQEITQPECSIYNIINSCKF